MLNYNKINELIKENNLSIRAFSQSIGMTGRGLADSLKNQTLKVETLEKIADYFKKPISYFFDEAPTKAATATDFKEKYYELLEKYNSILESITKK